MNGRLLHRLRSRKAFTLTELIIVIGLIGLLSLIIIPRIGLYSDKAMGLTALTDCKTVMAAALTHNMNNARKFDNSDLQKRMGLGADNRDSSGMKAMERSTSNIYLFIYQYRRGDVMIDGRIDILSQEITWSLYGLNRTEDPDRVAAIEDGLKITRGTLTLKSWPTN